jgi:hypothetical protein
MHHLQRSGRMLARLHLAVNRSFCPPKMPKPQRDPTLASISVAILCREIALYILLKPKLLAKDLKPLRAAVFIVFVFLMGCASTRQTSTPSHVSNVSGEPDIGVILSLADFHFDRSMIRNSFASLSSRHRRNGRGSSMVLRFRAMASTARIRITT